MTLDLNLGAALNATPVNIAVKPLVAANVKKVQDDGNLIRVSDIVSPLDRQAQFKITNTKIANVYNTLAKGTIPVGNMSTNTSGQAIFVELSVIASRAVSGQPDVLVPMVARIELKLPNDSDLTDAKVQELLNTAYAALCDPSAVLKVTDKMRGALYAF